MFSKNALFRALALIAAIGGGAVGTANAQSSSAYTDAGTGISFQRFLTTSYGGFSFGIALPSNPTTEFIGQVVGPVNTAGGWSGVSFGGGMLNNLLLVAWPHEKEIVHSLRYVTSYVVPGVYSGTATATKLYSTINSTHFSLTFRCQNCISWTNGGFNATADTAIMGWAQSISAVTDVTNPASVIPYHDNGFGQFGMLIGSAKSAKYQSWLDAAGAGSGTTVPSPTGTNTAAATGAATTTTAAAPPPPTGTTTPLGTFDYIVVGGGAGGLVTADRLSESGAKVLLIEKGPPSTFKSGGTTGPAWLQGQSLTRFDVPGLCNQIWVDSAGIACTDIDQMAGCLLGGGTAVNSGLFFKPQSLDWDHNFPTSWKSTDLVSATKKVFTRIPSTDNPSQDGIRYLQGPYNVLSTALGSAGWKSVTANNAPNEKNLTFSHTPYMYSNGERGGPLATYLQTAKSRKNFVLAVNSTVRRVVRSGGQITGVEVISTSGESSKTGVYSVTPKTGRVVLSAGTFGTAKILLRSGIGPADQLAVVKGSAYDGPSMISDKEWIKLPVGYHVTDHTSTDLVLSHPNITSYDFYAAYNTPPAADKTAYLSKRSGILATAAPGPNTMFWHSFVGADGITRQLQYTARSEGALGQSGKNLITISQYLGTGSTSRGRITIKEDLNMVTTKLPYLHDEFDKAAIVQGVAAIQAALGKASGVTWLQPAPGVTAKEYVDGYVASRRANHWMGSARLGTDDGRKGDGSTGSVVDVNAKVYGTNNLFVVDASIFPGQVTTNPSAPIMIAAERAVEKILALPK